MFFFLQGLQDDIHTVVIQALNTFDKIFPYVLFKYMTTPAPTTASTIHQDVRSTTMGAAAASSSSEGRNVGVGGVQHNHACQGRQHKASTIYNKQQQHHQHPHPHSEQQKHGLKEENRTATHMSRTKLKCISGHFNNNDGIIAALLNAFQLQANINGNDYDDDNSDSRQVTTQNSDTEPNNHIMNVAVVIDGRIVDDADADAGADGGKTTSTSAAYGSTSESAFAMDCCCCCCYCSAFHCCGSNLLFISPKLLLNKLRLCYYNKYWLVQNKYAEVISNLNYASLRSYYGNNYTRSNTNSNTSTQCGCSYPTSSDGCQLDGCGNCYTGDGWPYGHGDKHDDDDIDGLDFVCSLEVSIIVCVCMYMFVSIFVFIYLTFAGGVPTKRVRIRIPQITIKLFEFETVV